MPHIAQAISRFLKFISGNKPFMPVQEVSHLRDFGVLIYALWFVKERLNGF